jgi:hypothetical protein
MLSQNSASAIFAEYAPTLREHGLAPIPLHGKAPTIKNYGEWKAPPSAKTIAALAAKFPDANVGYVAGPSKLVVVDVDNVEDAAKCRKVFGDTAVSVRTRRGEHLFYKQPSGWTPRNANLRKLLGLNADLKAGRGILVAPASHFVDNSGYYQWSGHGLDGLRGARRDLPEFPFDKLERAADTAAPWRVRLRDGSRKQGLNDYLCSQVAYCDDFDSLVDVASTWNADLPEPLPDDVVMARAGTAWKHWAAGQLEPQFRQKATAKTSRLELTSLLALSRHGADAFALLMLLRAEHSARCRRGESFAISARRMAATQVLPGWTRDRIARARDLLLQAGKIICVANFEVTPAGRRAAQYVLTVCIGRGAGRFSYIRPESPAMETERSEHA